MSHLNEFHWSAHNRWLNPPAQKDDGPEFHSLHVEEGTVVGNALDRPAQFECCVQAFGEMVEKDLVCMSHPRAYKDPKSGWCEKCDPEEVKS